MKPRRDSIEDQYLTLLYEVGEYGAIQQTRAGNTKMLPGATLTHDLSNGDFPILTTKKVNFDAVKGELLGFIRGYTNAADFRALGCNIWDANANENKDWLANGHRKGTDDLGNIYGNQWRAYSGWYDQLTKALEDITIHPQSRRIIVTAWNPIEVFDARMALPPCHLLFQFIVEQQSRKLHLCMYQRSCDLFLGVPFNISSYALLLKLVAHVTDYIPGQLTMFLADCHIYFNHEQQVRTQLNRNPFKFPELLIREDIFASSLTPIQRLERFQPSDLTLINYLHNEAIKAEMNV